MHKFLNYLVDLKGRWTNGRWTKRDRGVHRVSAINLRVTINKLVDNSCSVIVQSQNGDFLLTI
ncbi:hypothetical protein K0M31_006677 [Melipona bicolor]|uniref:Uncharacterized protein n=1 Tax=Melipona bicolor TaxID=60889 RepID=A0AA40KL58_9HYME|nr:hypothetical protein K0M31_006677 [Melipona bicolor]